MCNVTLSAYNIVSKVLYIKIGLTGMAQLNERQPVNWKNSHTSVLISYRTHQILYLSH